MTRSGLVVPSEHEEQHAVVAWCRLVSVNPKLPHLAPLANIFAVGNFHGHVGSAVARMRAGARANAEGRSSGVPDLFLPHPQWKDGDVARYCEFHGLFIEMKRLVGGSVSATQRSWHVALRDAGYRVEICRGAEAAKDVLAHYVTPE